MALYVVEQPQFARGTAAACAQSGSQRSSGAVCNSTWWPSATAARQSRVAIVKKLMQACSHAFSVANVSSHAYSAPMTASTAHSPPTAFRAAPCVYPSQRARTVETTLPPTYPSAGAQAAHQPWLVRPRDSYDATTSSTLPGSGHISAGQSIAQNAGDSGYRHGQSPEIGTARLVQAPSQSVGHRTSIQVTSGSDQPVLVTARDEASTSRPQSQIPRLMSDGTRLGRKGLLWYLYNCLILARFETRRNIPKENFISDGANFGWYVYLRCMQCNTATHSSAGRGSERSTKYHNPQPRRGSQGHPSQSRTTTQPEHVHVSSNTSSAAGKKRSQRNGSPVVDIPSLTSINRPAPRSVSF